MQRPVERQDECLHNVFLDIETIPLPVERREVFRPTEDTIKLGNLKDPNKIKKKIESVQEEWEAGKDCALDPLQGRIAVIGYAIEDEPVVQLYDEDEGELLCDFWNRVTKEVGFFIAHNVRFDAGFILRRSILNDISFPAKFAKDLWSYRPKIWIDTMDLWNIGNRGWSAGSAKLEHLCYALGIPVKGGEVTGKDFHLWWEKDKEKCLEYNRDDVNAVREVYDSIRILGG